MGGLEDATETEAEQALRDLIARVSYKPGWSFEVERPSTWLAIGALLVIRVQVIDSVSGEPMEVCHRCAIPYIPMDERRLRHWLFERVVLVERHEAMEFFKVDGTAPYFPDHTPGGDPYGLVDAAD